MRGHRWVARPILAAVIRLFILIVPAVAGMLAGWAVTGMLGEPEGAVGTLLWWTALVTSVVATVMVVQRLARRLLPLTWLLHLTLSFPDRAPSRLSIARRAARARSLRRAADEARREGLGEDAETAAARALVLVAALGAHDKRTRGHSERVRSLADVLAEEAGVSDADRDKLRWAALLHDIGKLAVPGEILNKPDRPDEREWATLQRHPEEGDRLVAPLVAWLGPWAASVAHHHEHWDGSGYPRGLAGEDISLGGRILAIADAYEVMTAARPYKPPQRPDVARQELVASAGSHFDPVLVRHFLAVSLGRLWLVIGGAAFVSLVPWLAKLWTVPAGAAMRRTSAGPAAAAVAVGALAVAGVVAPAATPTGSGPSRTETAAPASTPATPAPSPPAAPDPASAPVPAPAGAVVPANPGPDLRPLRVPPPGPPASLPVSLPASPSEESGPTPAAEPAPEAAPFPAETTPPAPVVPPPGPLFSARGQLLLPSLLGLTEAEVRGSCGVPVTQGVDALAFELPAVARVAGAPVRVTGSDLLGLHNLDVTFYSGDCRVLGQLTEDGADEAGPLPAGTVFVVIADRLGIATSVELSVG